MEILINQVGFDIGAPKSLLVQADQDLGGAAGRVQIVDQSGMLRYEADLDYAGTVKQWGWHYWRADFSGFNDAGTYEIRARLGREEITYEPLVIGEQQVARATLARAASFYYYQRCGAAVPGWHEACHLDDARLADGTHIDAVGGWHDAGDYNKYNGYTPLSVYALARASRHPLLATWSLAPAPPPAEEVAWGAQWLAKMQDPQSGFLRGDVFSGYGWWGPPERETDNRPGTEDDRPVRGEPSAGHRAGSALLAFRAVAGLRRGEGQWERCAQLLERALGAAQLPLVEQAAAMLACLEQAGAAEPQLERAVSWAQAILAQQRSDGSFHEPQIVDQGFVPAALAEVALRVADDDLARDLRAALLRYVEFSLARSRNPFRVMEWDHENFFYPYGEPKAWYVGQNSMYLSQAWALLLAARVLERWPDPPLRAGAARARELAWAQLGWVLGGNPFGVCMVEGAGRFNPPRYHHRYDSLPGHERGAVPGAVCNGVVRESVERDAPRFDLKGNDYHSNEPWLPHNAYYLLAVSQL